MATATTVLHVFHEPAVPGPPAVDAYSLEVPGAYVRFKTTDDNLNTPPNPLIIGQHAFSQRKLIKIRFEGTTPTTTIMNLKLLASLPVLGGATLWAKTEAVYSPPPPAGPLDDLHTEADNITTTGIDLGVVGTLDVSSVVMDGVASTDGYGLTQDFVMLQLQLLSPGQSPLPASISLTWQYDEA